MAELVRLKTRSSRDGERFTYMLDYSDERGRRRRESLGHADRQKAERQRAQRERELRIGDCGPEHTPLSVFVADSMERTRSQVRGSTLAEHETAMKHFIEAVGDMDIQDVKHRHGEMFLQARMDKGDAPATVNKKLAGLKRLFHLAVLRGQLEQNPLRHIQRIKVPVREVHVFSDDECNRLLRVAGKHDCRGDIDWEMLVVMALCTAMRRGELLNTIWADIDLDKLVIRVSPKNDTKYIWAWRIKDSERRTLPLTSEVAEILKSRRTEQLTLHPYVLIPPSRYRRIQERREQNRWTAEDGRCPVNNFNRGFRELLERAGIETGEFHDLRRTCLSRWLANGLTEYDVMRLAGHSEFSTTHRFYLAVRSDLTDRARAATAAAMSTDLGAQVARASIPG